MKKNAFIQNIQEYQGKLGMWEIDVENLSMADYILGCYYDNVDKEWKVYTNGERGTHSIRLLTKNEDEAFDKLFSMVKFQYKVINC